MRGFTSAAARRCVAALKEGRPAPAAVLELSAVHEDPTFVLAPGHDAAQLEAFGDARRAPRRQQSRCGRTTRDRAAARSRQNATRSRSAPGDPCRPVLRGGARPLPRRARHLDRARRRLWYCRRSANSTPTRPASWRSHAPPTRALEVPGLGGELKPFQRAGVSYLLAQRRAFLADEQGLGKTIEALATLEADGAYPAIVVCPASLKLNWMREIERWLPASQHANPRRHGRRGATDPDRRHHGRQLRHPRRTGADARGDGAQGARARRVPLLQERGRQAHPGRGAPGGERAKRRPRAGARPAPL